MKLHMKIVSLIVLISFINTIVFPEVYSLFGQENIKKITVGVWNFDAQGISKPESITISQRFRSKLVETNIFDVVERNEMDAILNEQGFQMSGCTSDECVVEAGQLLGVQKMITGMIGKVGTIYTLDIRVIDIESGKIERTVSRDYNGNQGGLLDYLDEVAKEISGIIIVEPPKKWPWIITGVGVIAGILVYILIPDAEKSLKKPPAFPLF